MLCRIDSPRDLVDTWDGSIWILILLSGRLHVSSLQPLLGLFSIAEYVEYSIKRASVSHQLTITDRTFLMDKVAVPSRYRRHIPL